MKVLGIIPEIYVKGELVPCVNEIVCLGHVIKNDRSDTLVESYFNNIVWYFVAFRIVPCIIKILKEYMSQVEKR